jgi:prepilin-type N-terminal cleavage/methylation domain-containing protein
MYLPCRAHGGAAARRLATDRGVTLAELILVLAMIGIVTAIALPRINTARYTVGGTTQALGTALIMAQREAVARQHDVIAQFDAPNRNVAIHWDTDNDGLIDAGERRRVFPLGEGVVFGRGSAPARPFGTTAIAFDETVGGLPALVFHRNGSASDDGGFYLTSVGASGGAAALASDARAIEIVRATGRPEWWQYDGTAWRRKF